MFKVLPLLCLAVCLAPLSQAQGATNYDFCSLPKSTSGDAELGADARLFPIWNAATVNAEISRLVESDGLRSTPLAAYPTSYVAMTAARDRERCQGSLKITDRPSRLIGDLLADLMSRWLVLSVEDCRPVSTDALGICGSVSRTVQFKLGTLESALDMTAVYLSSHMATAIVAVAYDDQFWEQEFPESTHCLGHPCSSSVWKNRADYLKQYKLYYDLNNKFLASNLTTVVQSLENACLIRGPAISLGAKILERLPLENLFKSIRDETFSAALATLAAIDPATHPMLRVVGGKYVTQFDDFKIWNAPPWSLVRGERNSRALLANSLLKSGLGLLGSKSAADLAGLDCHSRSKGL
jgi:hypothetical protein